MISKIQDLIKSVLPIMPAAILLKGIAVIDQYYAGKLGMQYLNSHSFIIYLPFIIAPIGRALGMPLLVVLNKTDNHKEKSNYIYSGFLISFLFSIIMFLTTVVVKDFFFSQTAIAQTNGISIYYYLQSLACSIMLCNAYLIFTLLAQKKSKAILFGYTLSFTLNLTGNYISVTFFENESAIIGLGVATVVSILTQLVFQVTIIKKDFALPDQIKASLYLKRIKRIGSSHLITTIIDASTPLIIGILIQRTLNSSYATMFNITDKYIHFLLIPIISLRTYGTSWLISQLRGDSPANSNKAFIVTSLFFTLIPLIFVSLLSDNIYDQLTSSSSRELSYFSKLLLLRVLITGFFLFPVVKLDIIEKTHVNTILKTITSVFVIIILFANIPKEPLQVIYAIYLPMTLMLIFLSFYVFKSKNSLALASIFVMLFYLPSSRADERLETFRIGYLGPSLNKSPQNVKNIIEFLMLSPVHRRLVSIDYRGRIVSDLARSWKISKDFRKYTFNLHSNLEYRKNLYFECKDVIKIFENNYKKRKRAFIPIKDMSCYGKTKLEVLFEKPNETFLNEVGRVHNSIFLNKKGRILGLGQYRIITNNQNKTILEIKRNLESESDLPLKIEFIRFSKRESLLKSFKEKKIDYVPAISISDELHVDSNQVIVSNIFNRIHFLNFGKSFNKKELSSLRSCISNSIKRDLIIPKYNFKSPYSSAYGVSPPDTPGYLKMSNIYNIENQCLNLVKINLDILIDRHPKELISSLESQLKIVLPNLKVNRLDFKNFIKKIKTGNFDLSFYSYGLAADPVVNFKMFYTPNEMFPSSNYISKDDYSFLSENLERDELNYLIKRSQNIENRKNLLIPIIYEKNISLLQRCLKFKNRNSIGSGNTDSYKVVLNKECHSDG